MSGFPAIARLLAPAAIAGAVGALATSFTARHRAEYEAQLAADNEGKEGLARRVRGDDLDATVDGKARLAMAGLAVGGLAAAAGAALLHQPAIALGALGAATGLAGAALLGGTGSIKRNGASMIDGLSSMFHAAMLPTPRSVRAQLPLTNAPPEPKPTEAALRAAPLAAMPGKADLALAKKNAAKAIAAIDFSKPDIVIWVPGTGVHEMDRSWTEGARKQFGDRATLTMVDYPALQDFRDSASTGMETLRLVLAEIAKRGGEHRVMVGGQSQGSFVIADAIADPALHAAVDRVVLYGNMGLALNHYDDRHDAKVVEVNDAHDPVRHSGALREQFMNAMTANAHGIKPKDLLDAGLGVAANWNLVGYWQLMVDDKDRWRTSDPHHYLAQHPAGLEWLDTGTVRPGEQTQMVAD